MICFISHYRLEGAAQTLNYTKVFFSQITANNAGFYNLQQLTGIETKFISTDERKNIYFVTSIADSNLTIDGIAYPKYNSLANSHLVVISSFRCDESLRWVKPIFNVGQKSTNGLQYNNGNIYVAGCFLDTAAITNRHIGNTAITGHDFQHYFLASFDTLGTLNWIQFVGANERAYVRLCQ